MAKRRSFIDRLPLGPVFALLFGTAVAIVIAATPQPLFESAVAATGLGSVLSLAQPPLGLKARLLAVMLGFALVAMLVWLAVEGVQRLMTAPRTLNADDADDRDALDLGAYAELPQTSAGLRRPILAGRELGAPLMSDEALATASSKAWMPEPVRQDELADADDAGDVIQDDEWHDVAASPEVVAGPVASESLDAPLAPEEFALPPGVEPPPPVAGESSIDALIRRLEAGFARRAGPPPPSPPAAAMGRDMRSRDWLSANRDSPGSDDDTGRAIDALQRLALRRMAG